MKICTQCEISKPLTEFYRNRNHKDGRSYYCKQCERKNSNSENGKAIKKRYKQSLKGKAAIRRDNTSEKGKLRHAKYEKSAKGRAKDLKYMNKRYATDSNFRMKAILRSRMREALKNNKKLATLESLVGCTVPELKVYLESLFEEGMSWDNWAVKGWHIDHIKPCSLFDFKYEDHQRECFHYTNLQPLWAKDNIAKSNKYTEK